MAEDDGFGMLDDVDFEWLYVEDDYPLSVCLTLVPRVSTCLQVAAGTPSCFFAGITAC